MTVINSEDYQELTDFSESGGQREAGPFINAFICGQPRDDQTPGTISAIYSKMWDDPGTDKYVVQNAKSVYFVPMFIKKVRSVIVHENERDVLKWFSFDPDSDDNYPAGAKISVIVAGALLDENYKTVLDKEDPERAAFVYFNCKGIKCGAAFDLLGALNDQAEKLDPLSDNPVFEKNVILPRRFVIKCLVSMADSDYGKKHVYKFEVHKKLPDASVAQIMERCKKWTTEFKKQFDYSSTVASGSAQPAAPRMTDEQKKAITFDDDSQNSAAGDSLGEIPDEELDIGI